MNGCGVFKNMILYYNILCFCVGGLIKKIHNDKKLIKNTHTHKII